jgi:phage tail tube protein FII
MLNYGHQARLRVGYKVRLIPVEKNSYLCKRTCSGVYYRYNTLKKAYEFHLTGWVKTDLMGMWK